MLTGLFLLASMPSPIQAQTLFPRTQLSVFDSNDVKVGSVLGMFNDKANPLWVAFTIEGHLIALRVTKNQLKGPDGVEAYYLSQECAGEPHFKFSQIQGGQGMLPTALIGPPGQTVYVVDDDDLSLIFYPQSRRLSTGPCEKVNFTQPIKLRPGKGIINLEEVFTPPYHIR
ncbi:hypothetical protein [Candidatus Nitronereus thalassa]|uniref:Uncharacterized protein n=1 Tax=Candidatus Nitronereus thalassa TaxID=3020898 RepID=A0ABU3K4T8_9BACT|nr:hypothetical protein [Candidatus Nitronereus thalassa]MDT7041391.1 hypothetical protein [Candidatus Nitronereus thalassa]